MQSILRIFAITLLAFISISSYALNPSRKYKQRPDKYSIKYTEVKVKTNDGTAELNLWLFPNTNTSNQTMVVLHNGEGNMADYFKRVNEFKKLGFNVVLFDYRGYGESSDFEIVSDMYIYTEFTDDVQSILDYCSNQLQTEVSVYGWGIGAGLALGVGYNRHDISLIIADTPFLTLDDLESRFAYLRQWKELPTEDFPSKYEPLIALEQDAPENLKGIQIMLGANDPLFQKKDLDKLRLLRHSLIRRINMIQVPSGMDNFKANKEKYFFTIGNFIESTI